MDTVDGWHYGRGHRTVVNKAVSNTTYVTMFHPRPSRCIFSTREPEPVQARPYTICHIARPNE